MEKTFLDNQIIIPKHEDLTQEHINKIGNMNIKENLFETVQSRELVISHISEIKTTTNYAELDDTFDSMIQKCDAGWSCTQCEKLFKGRARLKDHIEVHIDSVSHPCNQCGKQFRSRNSLKKHTSVFYKH